MNAYDDKFFAHALKGSTSSARVVIQILRSLIHFKSVADVGCGTGAWLSMFAETGTTHYLGIDAPWAERAGLIIARARVLAAHFTTPPLAPRRCDLPMCRAAAELLP